jgi:DNA-binding winged helix-turn-helix (wHTH) protein
MERSDETMLRIGAWCVNPASGQISRGEETARVEVRTMRLLLCLAEHAGEVVSIDDLLNQVWSGVIVSPDSVYQAVASLRRLLGDDPKQPSYIETVPRLGYRMVATVSPWATQPSRWLALRVFRAANIGPRRKPMRRQPARVSEPGSRGRRLRRLVWRSSLASCFTVGSLTTIAPPQPPLPRSRRNPSPYCRFST